MEKQRHTERPENANRPTDDILRRRILKASATASALTFSGWSTSGVTLATRRDRAQRGGIIAEDERQVAEHNTNRAPVRLKDGSEHYFTYEDDLDIGAIADWEETDRNDVPVWDDDETVHWIDTTVHEPDATRPELEITIYQEVVFTATCDGTGFAHPALTPGEWMREDQVSTADLSSWFRLLGADEVKAAFDRVIRQLDDTAVETPSKKYGVSPEERAVFRDERYPGVCHIYIVGIDPQQVVQAGVGPLPAARNGAVTLRIPELPESDWERLYRGGEGGPTKRPHHLVLIWDQVLTEPIAVDLAPRRHVDKLLARDNCDGE